MNRIDIGNNYLYIKYIKSSQASYNNSYNFYYCTCHRFALEFLRVPIVL